MGGSINTLRVGSLQKAWELANEVFIVDPEFYLSTGGNYNGSEITAFDVVMICDNARVDQNFDFGKVLGYKIQKWNSLVSNYLDVSHLEIVRSEVSLREVAKDKSYNLAMHFENAHGSGKDCLIGLHFAKRPSSPRPIVTYFGRTSEVTCRLLFDLLLIQRIIEFVYGTDDVEVRLIIPTIFAMPDRLVMYNNHKDIYKLLRKSERHRKGNELHKFQLRFKERLDKMMNTPLADIKFKVTLRAAAQIQIDPFTQEPLAGVPSLLASDLTLSKVVTQSPSTMAPYKLPCNIKRTLSAHQDWANLVNWVFQNVKEKKNKAPSIHFRKATKKGKSHWGEALLWAVRKELVRKRTIDDIRWGTHMEEKGQSLLEKLLLKIIPKMDIKELEGQLLKIM